MEENPRTPASPSSFGDAFTLGRERGGREAKMEREGEGGLSHVVMLLFQIATEVAFTANSLIKQMSNVC